MIPGVVSSAAQGLGVAGGGGEEPPSGGAMLDFVAGTYEVGGEAYDIDELLGDGFNEAAIDAQGMFVDEPFSDPPGGTNRPNLIGPLFDAVKLGFENGCTIVLEVELTQNVAPADSAGPLLRFCSTSNASNGDGFVYADTTFNDGVRMQDFDSLFFDGGGPFGSGDLVPAAINRIALTINQDVGGGMFEYAISCNGGTATTQQVAYNTSYMTLVRVSLMHIEEFLVAPTAWYLRKLELQDEVVDAVDLPAVSALP